MDGRKVILTGLALACLVATGCVTVPHRGETAHKAKTFTAFGDMQAAGGFKGTNDPEAQNALRHEAELAYLEAIKVDPRYIPAYLGLARLHKAKGDSVAALGVYQQALQLENRNAGLWHEVGMTQCKLKKYEEGIQSLKKALEMDPDNSKYKMALGGSLVLAGQPEQGFRLLASLKGEAKAHLDLARIYDSQGLNDHAAEHLVEARRLDPNILAPLPTDAKPLPPQDLPPTGEVIRTTYQPPVEAAPATQPVIQNGVPLPSNVTSGEALPVLSLRGK
jgi:Tfp pilus assembly protein PilF